MSSKAAPKPHRRERLLALLADGKFHSGEALAKRLRVSRSAVWKLINALRELGVGIEAVARQGYNLPHAVELYQAEQIKAKLPAEIGAALERLEVLLTVDSTNRLLAASTPPPAGQAAVCVAEIQQAGRGRRGRTWLAPFGSGICLSLAWSFEDLPPSISAVGLAVGVAVVRVLRNAGAADVGLKWPNDLFYRGRKLGGILIELRGESSGPAQVVIGIGLNLRMPIDTRMTLAEKHAVLVADLHEILRDRTPGRNELVAALIAELFVTLREFASQGFKAFHAAWSDFDVLFGTPIKVMTAEHTVQGFARGVDVEGALLLETNGQVQRYISGEVSVKPSDAHSQP